MSADPVRSDTSIYLNVDQICRTLSNYFSDSHTLSSHSHMKRNDCRVEPVCVKGDRLQHWLKWTKHGRVRKRKDRVLSSFILGDTNPFKYAPTGPYTGSQDRLGTSAVNTLLELKR